MTELVEIKSKMSQRAVDFMRECLCLASTICYHEWSLAVKPWWDKHGTVADQIVQEILNKLVNVANHNEILHLLTALVFLTSLETRKTGETTAGCYLGRPP